MLGAYVYGDRCGVDQADQGGQLRDVVAGHHVACGHIGVAGSGKRGRYADDPAASTDERGERARLRGWDGGPVQERVDGLLDVLGKRGRGVIDALVGALCPDDGSAARAGGRDDRRAGVLGELGREAADAAAGAVDQRQRRPGPWRHLRRRGALWRASFARRFVALVGRPPLVYLTWWRMTVAAARLRESDDPLRTVATAVGYTSEFAFAAAFKCEFGISPGRYRAAENAPTRFSARNSRLPQSQIDTSATRSGR